MIAYDWFKRHTFALFICFFFKSPWGKLTVLTIWVDNRNSWISFWKLIRGPPRDHSDIYFLIWIRKRVSVPQPNMFNIASSTAKETLLTKARKNAYIQALARKPKEVRPFSRYTRLQQGTTQTSLFEKLLKLSMNVYKMMPFEKYLKPYVNLNLLTADGDRFCHPSMAWDYSSWLVVPAFAIYQQTECWRFYTERNKNYIKNFKSIRTSGEPNKYC